MRLFRWRGLTLLHVLVSINLVSATIPQPAALASESIATITSSYASTVTNVVTSTFLNVVSTTTCIAGTSAPTSTCSDYVWSLRGKYYQETCDASVYATTTIAQLSPYTHLPNIWECYVYCSIFGSLCNGVDYNPSSSSCGYIKYTTAATFISKSGHHQSLCSNFLHSLIIWLFEIQSNIFKSTFVFKFASFIAFIAFIVFIPNSNFHAPCCSYFKSTFVFKLASFIAFIAFIVFIVFIPDSSFHASCCGYFKSTFVFKLASFIAFIVFISDSNFHASSSVKPQSAISSKLSTHSSATTTSLSVGRSSVLQSQTSAVYVSSSSNVAQVSSVTTHDSSSFSPPSQSPVSSSHQFTPSAVISSQSSRARAPSSPGSVLSITSTTQPAPASTTLESSGGFTIPTDKPTHKTSSTFSQVIGSTGGAAQQSSSFTSGMTTISESFSSEIATRLSTTSTVLTTRVATVTECPSSQPDCPVSGRSTFVTTETLVVSTTVCPLTEEPRPTTDSQPKPDNGATTQGGQFTNGGSTTSTIFSTRTATITACPSTVTNCPASAKSTYMTTETLVVSTTICPITEEAHSTTTTVLSSSSGTSLSSQSLQEALTTSTVLSTRVSAITACPSSVTDCSAPEKTTFLTTETIVVSTTIYPVTGLDSATSTAQSSPSLVVSASSAFPTVESGISISAPGSGSETTQSFLSLYGQPNPTIRTSSSTLPSSGPNNAAAYSSHPYRSAAPSKIIASSHSASSATSAVTAVFTGAAYANHWSTNHFIGVLISMAALVVA
ncbi:hypothetical protein N7495_010027 [Penicillium taxi]|uniref:uncharacterized protein n=1 Tax=Penicillium taxi TaxID=168475 RepID=UPI0025458EB0|nr:uncharacterized protein N7495_010027 [Penicillium taxi]KAJ5885517.1 hypothetical protein N7495_010027 [Penicillium taxi]